jgi:hypothetical protein
MFYFAIVVVPKLEEQSCTQLLILIQEEYPNFYGNSILQTEYLLSTFTSKKLDYFVCSTYITTRYGHIKKYDEWEMV